MRRHRCVMAGKRLLGGGGGDGMTPSVWLLREQHPIPRAQTLTVGDSPSAPTNTASPPQRDGYDDDCISCSSLVFHKQFTNEFVYTQGRIYVYNKHEFVFEASCYCCDHLIRRAPHIFVFPYPPPLYKSIFSEPLNASSASFIQIYVCVVYFLFGKGVGGLLYFLGYFYFPLLTDCLAHVFTDY